MTGGCDAPPGGPLTRYNGECPGAVVAARGVNRPPHVKGDGQLHRTIPPVPPRRDGT